MCLRAQRLEPRQSFNPVSAVFCAERGAIVGSACERVCIMNLGIDNARREASLSPQLVPLLVIAKDWACSATSREDAFLQTDVILLLLQGVQGLSGTTGEVHFK